MRAPKKALFIALILLITFLQPFLAIVPQVKSQTSINLWVNSFTSDFVEWDTEQGDSPYLDDNDNNWIHEGKTSGATEGYFGFEDHTGSGTINSVTLYVECYGDDINDQINVYVDCSDGLGWINEGTIAVDQLSYEWETMSLSIRLDSWPDIQNAQIYFYYQGIQGGDDIYVRRTYLYIDYETPPAPDWEYHSTYRGIDIQVWMPTGTPFRALLGLEWVTEDTLLLIQAAIDAYLGPEPEPQPGGSPSGMEQVLFGGYLNLLSSVITEYNSLVGGYTWISIEDVRTKIVSTDGDIKKLRVVLRDAAGNPASPGVGKKYTFTLFLNGNPTALTFDIADAATSGSNMVNEIDVTGGNRVSIECAPDNSPTAVYASWTCVFESDVANESLILGGCGVNLLNRLAIEYAQVMGATSVGSATENNFRQVVPTAGTIKNFYVKLNVLPGLAPDAYRFTLRKGGVSQSLTVTIIGPATTGNDLVNSFTVVAGDILTMMIEPLNTPAVSPRAVWGMTFEADVDGESIVLGGTHNNLPQVATEYNLFTSREANTWSPTEINRVQLGQVCTLKKLHLLLAGSPGGGNKYDFIIRIAEADSNVVTTISGAATTGDSGALEDDIALDEYVNLKVVPTSSPTIRDAYWGFVCYIPVPPVKPNIPSLVAIVFNTTIAENGCGIYAAFFDTEGLYGYVFWNNATSAPGGVNSSFTSMTGTSNSTQEDVTLPSSGTKFGCKYYVNDTDGNWGRDTLIMFPTAAIGDGAVNVPAINAITFNTTIADAGCGVYASFSDVEGLDGYIFWNNATSAPGGVNSTFTGLAGVSDSTQEDVTLPSSGTKFGVKYYVSDTDGNWGVDSLVMFPVAASIPHLPSVESIEFNTTLALEPASVRGVFYDLEGLSTYIFWNNATNPPIGINSSVTGLPIPSAMENITLPDAGIRVGVRFYVNDTDDNWAVDTIVMFPTAALDVPQVNYPYVVSLTLNSTEYDSITKITGVFTDKEGLSGRIFWNNATNPPIGINGSWTPLGGAISAIDTITMPDAYVVVGLGYYVNDTDGNWAYEPIFVFPALTTEPINVFTGSSGIFGILLCIITPIVAFMLKRR